MANEPAGPRGYVTAWLGAVIGGCLGAIPGILGGLALGDVTSSAFDEIATGITYAAYGFFLAAWVGASVGCGVGLRVRGCAPPSANRADAGPAPPGRMDTVGSRPDQRQRRARYRPSADRGCRCTHSCAVRCDRFADAARDVSGSRE